MNTLISGMKPRYLWLKEIEMISTAGVVKIANSEMNKVVPDKANR